MPQHLDLQAATTLIFHDEGYQVTLLDNFCLLGPNEEHEILTENSVSMLFHQEALQDGSMADREERLSFREVDRTAIPSVILSHCGNRRLVQSEVTSESKFLNSTMAYDDYMELTSPPIESMFNENRIRRGGVKRCPKSNCKGNDVFISCSESNCDCGWVILKH